ncbi:MAG: YhdP family protein [Gammaproteobacteria bacterium]
MASLGRRLWKWSAGLFAALTILSALLVGAFRIAVDQLPEYRTPIEQWASRVLGLPVEIGGMDARFGLGGPEILLRDASILSADGSSELLQADTARVSLDVSELILSWQIKGDLFTVDGAQLDIRRDNSGEIFILGIPVSDIKPRGEALLADIRLSDGRVVFRDEMDGGVTWVFQDAEVDLSGSNRELRLDVSLTPPDELAQKVTGWASGTVNEAGLYSAWRMFAWFDGLQFSKLPRVPGLQALPDLAGRADMRVWLDVDGGELVRVSTEAEARGVALAGAMTSAEGAGYELIEGRVDWDRADDGWRLQASDLLVRRAGRDWRNPLVAVISRQGENGSAVLEVTADRIRLQDVLPMVPLLPDPEVRDPLLALNPRGDLQDLVLVVETLPGETPERRIELDVLVDQLGLDPWEKVPGLNGLSGRVRSDPRGGRLEFDAQDVSLVFPDLFRESLALDRFGGLIVWSKGSDGLTIIGDELRAANADLDLESGFRLRLPGGDAVGSIDLEARMRDVNLGSASRYLPVAIMSPKVVGWLDRGLSGGNAPWVKVQIHGPLRGFPYRNDEGVFQVEFDVEDMVLDYATGWPELRALQAAMRFENEGYSADLRSGQAGDLTIADVEVSLPDLRAGQLSIRGPASGGFYQLQQFLLSSPIAPSLGEGFAELRVDQGNATAAVDLLLPLRDLAAREIRVDVDLSDGVLGYGQIPHRLHDVTGSLLFEDFRISADDISASLFDQPVSIDIRPMDDGSTRAYARGAMTGPSLLNPVGMPLADHLDGISDWQAYVHFPGTQPDGEFYIHLDSELQGMAIDLPAPLFKSAADRMPLAIDFRFPQAGITEWEVNVAEQMSAVMRFAVDDGAMQIQGANLQIGGSTASAPVRPGLVIGGETDQLSVDDWLSVDYGPDQEGGPEQILTAVDLTVTDLRLMGQHVSNAELSLQQDTAAWQADISSETISGSAIIPFDLYGDEPVVLELERLAIDDEEIDGGDDRLDPKLVPSATISIGDFSMESVRLGRMSGEIQHLPDGFSTEGLRLEGDSFIIELAGSSLQSALRDESRFTLQFNSDDVGGALKFMGFASGIDAEKGEFTADIGWTGGLPPSILAVATGEASINLDQGSLEEVEPGSGRVFGLLSVQALPQRLLLDFRDVFQKGLYFEKFRGKFAISDGKAYSDNMVLKGRAADIGIVGTVDLVDRTYDQVAVVSAEVGNTLPVVGAIAAGPAIGAGLFVLKEIFKDSLSGIIRAQYSITGPWDDPVVERLTGAPSGTAAGSNPDADSASDSGSREQP